MVVGESRDRTRKILSQIERCSRASFSTPPLHGAKIVQTILGDRNLRQSWKQELGGIRFRIRRIRELLYRGLEDRGVQLHATGNEFIVEQKGMFSYSCLGKVQVERLIDEDGIYLVGSGRINMAGLAEPNIARLCDALAKVCNK